MAGFADSLYVGTHLRSYQRLTFPLLDCHEPLIDKFSERWPPVGLTIFQPLPRTPVDKNAINDTCNTL